jgi:hypothetical protein
LRTANWDSGVRWDDPNFYWGDPSYILEPGDPGYVPPASALPNNPNPRKRKKPMKEDPIADGDEEFAAQLQAFKLAIGSYSTLLGLSAGEVTAQAADADYFRYALQCETAVSNSADQWNSWKRLIREGGTPPPEGLPAATVLPTTVPVVDPGVEARFRALIAKIKKHPSYNEAIGQALGIEGAEVSGPDFSTFAPKLKLEQTGAGVLVRWGWQGKSAFLDMCEIEVDRGDGFKLLAFDTTPNYLDTTVPTTAAKWTYRAIYRVGDARVGQWSAPVSIAVAG